MLHYWEDNIGTAFLFDTISLSASVNFINYGCTKSGCLGKSTKKCVVPYNANISYCVS